MISTFSNTILYYIIVDSSNVDHNFNMEN